MTYQLRNQIKFIDNSIAVRHIAEVSDSATIILDFDETLWLRNSTAEYINSLRPRWVGFILVQILMVLRPWLWFPGAFRGDKIRDWFLVVIPSLLLPWSLFLWRRNAPNLALSFANQKLITVVKQNPNSSLIVASLGFTFIIDPLLQQILDCDRLVACRFWQGAGDRQKDKLAMIANILSQEDIEQAILVTDSLDDRTSLEVVGTPCLVQWPKAQYVFPFSNYWLYSWLQKLRVN